MSTGKDENIFLLKGNSLFNNELIQFKSLEMNDQKERRMSEFNAANYSSLSNYSTGRDEELLEKLDQLNMNQQTIESTVESKTKEIQSTNTSNLFAQDMMMKNFNSFLRHQNQLISEDISSSVQINEKDSSFEEDVVDYRIEHIRKLASGLFMMNGGNNSEGGLIKSKASTLQKEMDYGMFADQLKKYPTELISDSNKSENSDDSCDKLFNLEDAKNDHHLKNEQYQKTTSSPKNSTKNELIKNDSKSHKKYDDKSADYRLEDDLKAFEENLLKRYKKLAESNEKSSAKLYDSTGELNGASSPSSLNSIKSSDMSTTLADYNYLGTNSETSTNHQILNDGTMDYMKLSNRGSSKALEQSIIDNSKEKVDQIEQKLNESRTENLNLMIALENNNTTMKKNLEMAKSLKDELESTKSNFAQFKQQTNSVVENLMSKNKALNQELVKAKQISSKFEEKQRELDDLKAKSSSELEELRNKLKEKEDQLKLTTADLFQSKKRIKDQTQKLNILEQKLEDCDKKLNVYVKELNSQKSKLELNNEEIDIRKRRILTLEENLGAKINELESSQEEMINLKKVNKQLEEKNEKLLQAVKQVDTYADKYKMEYEKRICKEKDLNDFKQAIKRVMAERDETLKQLELLKSNWKQYQQQTAEQQLQLQQQLTTTTPSIDKYPYQTAGGRLNKIYSSPSLNDYYDTSNSIVPTRGSMARSQSKHRLNEQNDLLALEKIEDDKSSLMNVLSKQNYLNNLLSISEQLNCDQCMLSNSYSQFNTLQMNGSNSKQHLADHCADLMNHIRQQKELQQNELAFMKNGKKLKKESQKITKLEKKSKSTFSLFNPTLMLHGFKHKA